MKEIVLLMMSLNASSGQPLSIEPVRDAQGEVITFSSAFECHKYLIDMEPAVTKDGVSKVFACALPPKEA